MSNEFILQGKYLVSAARGNFCVFSLHLQLLYWLNYPVLYFFPLQAAMFHQISKGALQLELSFHQVPLNFWSKCSIFYKCRRQILLEVLLLGIYLFCA